MRTLLLRKEITKMMAKIQVVLGRRLVLCSLNSFSSGRLLSHKVDQVERTPQSFRAMASQAYNPASRNGEKDIKTIDLDDTCSNTSYSKQKKSSSILLKLALRISRETERLDRWLKAQGVPKLGFDVDSPPTFPHLGHEIQKSRAKIIRATEDLSALVMGIADSMMWMAWGASLSPNIKIEKDAKIFQHNNSLSLHAIYHYNIAKSFPIHETATFAQIAKKVGLSELNVRRFLRHAMTNRIFKEVKPGVVAHTAASRLLAENSRMNDWVGFCVEEMWQAASLTISALERNPQADDPTQTGFCLSNSTCDVENMFTTLAKSSFRSARMGGAMHSLTDNPGYGLEHLISSHDWASLNSRRGIIVDIGGSHGFVSIELASKFPQLQFVVQDTLATINSASPLTQDLSGRIKFQVHDFHTPQPIKGADVYFFRWIFHNYSDRFAIPMLRNLVPALKKGAQVLINDYCHPGPTSLATNSSPMDFTEEKTLRAMDLTMLSLLNSQERDENDFRMLFKAADERFRFVGVRTSPGSSMSVIQAIWEGEDFGI